MDTDPKIREQLVKLLNQGRAFTPLPELLRTVPYEVAGVHMDGFSHTVWELMEHIRIALHDLVEYSKDSTFQSPPWPEGYWPEHSEPDSRKAFLESIEQILTLQQEMISLVQDPANDLFEPFQANPAHNLFRQATIAAEHTAYHGGQLAMLSTAIERKNGKA